MAKSNIVDAGIVLGEVMRVEHVCANPPIPLRLQCGLVIHRHPNSVFDGRERIVSLGECEVVIRA